MFFVRAFFLFVLVCLVAWGLMVVSVVAFGRLDQATEADAILVLGAAQYDGRPSPVLKGRLDHGIQLHRHGYSSLLILTGGVGVGDTVSEAEVGQRYAVREGIPAENILLEPTGLSSEESMLAVANLMERNSLESVILVSDPFHMLRLRLLAARLDIRAYSSPTRTSPISDGSRTEWRLILRESLILPSTLMGGLAARLRGATPSP